MATLIVFLVYSAHLKEIASQETLDFSALQVVTKWIQCVQSNISLLSPILSSAQKLSEAFALSTGLGLGAIWSTFILESSNTSLTDLAKLARLAAEVFGTSI